MTRTYFIIKGFPTTGTGFLSVDFVAIAVIYSLSDARVYHFWYTVINSLCVKYLENHLESNGKYC